MKTVKSFKLENFQLSTKERVRISTLILIKFLWESFKNVVEGKWIVQKNQVRLVKCANDDPDAKYRQVVLDPVCTISRQKIKEETYH